MSEDKIQSTKEAMYKFSQVKTLSDIEQTILRNGANAIEQLLQENAQLKEKYSKLEDKYFKNIPCCNEDDCSLYNHTINTDYVLTEFEKWLEERIKISSTDDTYVNGMHFIGQNHAVYNGCFDKLQELKEGKK